MRLPEDERGTKLSRNTRTNQVSGNRCLFQLRTIQFCRGSEGSGQAARIRRIAPIEFFEGVSQTCCEMRFRV
jgi:hypothetical protein